MHLGKITKTYISQYHSNHQHLDHPSISNPYIRPLLAMIVLLTLAMLPVLLAQDQGKAETCSYLAGKISKLDNAITLSFCDLTGRA